MLSQQSTAEELNLSLDDDDVRLHLTLDSTRAEATGDGRCGGGGGVVEARDAAGFEFVSQLLGIDVIAVMGKRHISKRKVDRDWFYVLKICPSCRGVTFVTDSDRNG